MRLSSQHYANYRQRVDMMLPLKARYEEPTGGGDDELIGCGFKHAAIDARSGRQPVTAAASSHAIGQRISLQDACRSRLNQL